MGGWFLKISIYLLLLMAAILSDAFRSQRARVSYQLAAWITGRTDELATQMHQTYVRDNVCKKDKGRTFVFYLFVRTSPQKRSGMDHTAFTLQIHHTRLSPRKHSPDGATAASGSNRLITAYYSFIDPERVKDWVDLVSWPTADVLPI